MRVFIMPYAKGSKSAKNLSKELGAKRLRLDNSKFQPSRDKLVINWGNSAPQIDIGDNVVNKPNAILLASNKLNFFQQLDSYNQKVLEEEKVRHVPFTTDEEEVERWLAKGHVVVARHKLTGHSGQGIQIIEEVGDYDRAPLYTRYVKKQSEYRVHVMNGEVFDLQRKARKLDVMDDDINWRIRNYANGFIFARNEAIGEVPQDVKEQAVRAMQATGLDFGGVDVIYNEHEGKAYVVEINTACGLEGQTLVNYTNQFRKLLGEEHD